MIYNFRKTMNFFCIPKQQENFYHLAKDFYKFIFIERFKPQITG